MNNTKKTFFLSVIIFSVFLDQASKYLIRTQGGFYICNSGVAFGIILPKIALILIAAGLITFFYFLISKYKNLAIWSLATSLILSGAISNLIDRIYFGCVIDFINLKFWPIFNLADIYITIGAIILIAKFRTTD